MNNLNLKSGSFLLGAWVPFVTYGLAIGEPKLTAAGIATAFFTAWLLSRT